MQAQEEFMGSNDLTQIVKGKRTKRQRSSSPYKAGMASSSSSGCSVGGGEGVVGEEYYNSISSPTTTTNSSEVYESTEEEEDMANCLILLAQGEGPRLVENNSRTENFSSRKFSDLGVSTTSKVGFYVYECKTCNRSFPSFQALGGHRASHKKPKLVEEKKPAVVAPPSIDHDLDECQLNKISSDLPPISIHIASVSSISANTNKGFQSNNKSKIHECTICGSQFTSGQALGGHMRRHRPNVENNQVAMNMSSVDVTSCISTTIDESKKIKSRNILSLDLNLPAPEDDHLHRESQFKFASTQQALVFSAPSLVDCHY